MQEQFSGDGNVVARDATRPGSAARRGGARALWVATWEMLRLNQGVVMVGTLAMMATWEMLRLRNGGCCNACNLGEPVYNMVQVTSSRTEQGSCLHNTREEDEVGHCGAEGIQHPMMP